MPSTRIMPLSAILLVTTGYAAASAQDKSVAPKGAAPPKLELAEVEKQISQRWDALKTVTSDFTFTQSINDPTTTIRGRGSGKFSYRKNEDGRRLFQMQMKNSTNQLKGGQQLLHRSEMTMVDDGAFLYTYRNTSSGGEMAFKRPSNPEQIGGGGRTALRQLKAQYKPILRPQTSLDGVPCYVIEGQPIQKNDRVSKTESWFDKNSGMLLKVVTYGSNGKVVQEMRYSNVKLNEDIPKDKFVFTVPHGVEIQDFTNR